MIPAVDRTEWTPEEGKDTKKKDLDPCRQLASLHLTKRERERESTHLYGGQITGFRDRYSVLLSHRVVCRNNACCHKRGYHGVECHHHNLRVLLPFRPIARSIGILLNWLAVDSSLKVRRLRVVGLQINICHDSGLVFFFFYPVMTLALSNRDHARYFYHFYPSYTPWAHLFVGWQTLTSLER